MRHRTTLRPAVTLAALLLGAAPARADAVLPPETDRWIQLQTAHFTFFSNAGERRTRELGGRLERFRATLSRFNPKFHVDPPVATLIYVFRNDASLTPYKSRYNGKPVEMAGLFVGHPDGNYIVLNADKQGDPLQVIYHEYTHHILGGNVHRPPPWFNEGLAECYSTFRADDRTASIGLTIEDHVRFLREHDLLPLHDLFAITEQSPDYNEGDRRGVFYAESWALMHYLMWDKPQRRPQFARFLDRLSDGEEPDAAFPPSFETSYRTLENELRNYVRQGRYLYTVFHMAELKVDDTASVSPMSREQVLVRLADLLAHLDRDRAGEAAAHLLEAQRVSPGYAPAGAGLAYLTCEDGRYDEGIGLYEKATAAGPVDPVSRFQFGRCLSRRRSGSDVTRAEEMFAKTIQDRPGFAEAYVEYALLLMDQGGDRGAAIHLLEAARPMLPARIDVLQNLAVLYALNGDAARANRLVDDALARMNDREAVASTRGRLRAIGDSAVARKPPAPAAADDAPGTAADVPPRDDEPPPLPPAPGRSTIEGRTRVDDYNGQVAEYNEAVAHANLRDFKGAIAMLEDLLKRASEPGLRDQATALLAKIRKDAGRMDKSRR